MHAVVEKASAWEMSHAWLPGPPTWWLLGFYGALVVVVIAPRFRPRGRRIYSLFMLWVAVGLMAPVLRSQTENSLRCTFVAVGHGSAVLLEAPDGKTVLYDAGSLASPEFAARSVSAVLWEQGRRHLDAVVLSHADVDHYNALPELLTRFEVNTVFVSPTMFAPLNLEGTQSAPQALKQILTESEVPIEFLVAGDRLRLGAQVEVSVLHPPRLGVFESDNASSLTLKIDFAGRTILLPGDLEGRGLEDVMAELPIDCDIVMAPHHGSLRSDPPGFAAWSTPDWVVVSGAYQEKVKLVTEAYQQVGAEVLHTAESGAIEFEILPPTTVSSRGEVRVQTAIPQRLTRQEF